MSSSSLNCDKTGTRQKVSVSRQRKEEQCDRQVTSLDHMLRGLRRRGSNCLLELGVGAVGVREGVHNNADGALFFLLKQTNKTNRKFKGMPICSPSKREKEGTSGAYNPLLRKRG